MIVIKPHLNTRLKWAIAKKHRLYRYTDKGSSYDGHLYLLYCDPANMKWSLIDITGAGPTEIWTSNREKAEDCFSSTERWEPFYGTIEVTE